MKEYNATARIASDIVKAKSRKQSLESDLDKLTASKSDSNKKQFPFRQKSEMQVSSAFHAFQFTNHLHKIARQDEELRSKLTEAVREMQAREQEYSAKERELTLTLRPKFCEVYDRSIF